MKKENVNDEKRHAINTFKIQNNQQVFHDKEKKGEKKKRKKTGNQSPLSFFLSFLLFLFSTNSFESLFFVGSNSCFLPSSKWYGPVVQFRIDVSLCPLPWSLLSTPFHLPPYPPSPPSKSRGEREKGGRRSHFSYIPVLSQNITTIPANRSSVMSFHDL